jgi:hypothetical protein
MEFVNVSILVPVVCSFVMCIGFAFGIAYMRYRTV